jgi:hypothetical protein
MVAEWLRKRVGGSQIYQANLADVGKKSRQDSGTEESTESQGLPAPKEHWHLLEQPASLPSASPVGNSDDTIPVLDKSTAFVRTESIPLQPIWTEAQVDPLDSNYLHFFLSQMQDKVIFGDLFPEFLHQIFPRTLSSRPLLHAVLAVSSATADDALQRSPERSIVHKSHAIVSLQRSLAMGKVDEDIALSIFILLSMDPLHGRTISQNHLRGFSLVLNEPGINSSDPQQPPLGKISPPLMLVWRIDTGIAMVQRTMPVLPHYPKDLSPLQRPVWVVQLARDGRSVDLALALDTFVHRAVHWIFESINITNHEYLNNLVFRASYDIL